MIIEAVRRTTRTNCGHGCVIRRAGEVRASAPIRALVAAIVAFACATSVVSYAFAEESGGGGGGHSFQGPNVGIIFYGPVAALDANANQVTEVGVTAYNAYDAAAYVLGYSYGEVKSWSSDIRAKLSNSETGGRFWQLANTFSHTSNIDGIQWFTANILYGEDLCWRSLYSDELFRNALADCQTIINGGNVGGGSGGGSSTTITWDTLELTNKAGECYGNGVWSPMSSYTVRLHIDDAFKAQLNNELPSFAEWFVVMNFHNGNSTKFSLTFYMVDKDVTLSVNGNPSSSALANIVAAYDGSSLRYRDYTLPNRWSSSNDVVVNHAAKTIDFYFRNNNDVVYNSTTIANPWNIGNGHGFAWSDGSDVEVPVPPTNWPDEPAAPTPPELPEPGTNPTVTPTPWAPVISPSFDFDLNITTEPTSNDLIDWVKKIYYELRSFHTDEQDWFDEVGKGMDGLVDAVNDAQEQIYDELQTVDETLRTEGQKIRDYMYQMFHWLKDQLDFQNDSFNDSNIVYWLKRIWSKLGSGDINLRPTDPTSEPENWWDWLVKAIQNFLIGLAATSTELISEIADLASQVMHQFPFSIPWDIAAILGALATAPITPTFTVNIPAIEGWWDSVDFVIDLSPYDDAAATIRLMEKLLFTGFLIWKSKDLLEFMDVTKWFN